MASLLNPNLLIQAGDIQPQANTLLIKALLTVSLPARKIGERNQFPQALIKV